MKSIKLISLNIWGGHVEQPLLNFIQNNKHIDIFCFQEVYHNAKEKISNEDRKVNLKIFSELQDLLPDHQAFFRPVVNNIYGIGMFVNKAINVLNEGEVQIYNNPNYTGKGPAHSRNLQWAECLIQDKVYAVINVHGLWNGLGKTDTPDRIEQAKRIKTFMNSVSVPKVICGDFNLKPDTESVKIIGEGMMNQIEIHQVSSTRTKYYEKPEPFADYVFTSPEITVNDFKVLKDEVSDHTPLLIEFI